MSRWRRGEGPVGEAQKVERASTQCLFPFAYTGPITVWDPIHRSLEIGPAHLGWRGASWSMVWRPACT